MYMIQARSRSRSSRLDSLIGNFNPIKVVGSEKYWTYYGKREEVLSDSDRIIGHIVQLLFDTLSNNFLKHCPIIIGHNVKDIRPITI